MFIETEGLRLPATLIVAFAEVMTEEPWPYDRIVEATAPEWPGFVGRSRDRAGALRELHALISDTVEPGPSLQDQLVEDGFDDDVLSAWSIHMRGRLASWRHDPACLQWLYEYERCGVPARAAVEYVALGLGPESAASVESAGGTPKAVRPYVHGIATLEPVASTCFQAWNESQVVAWYHSELASTEAQALNAAGFGAEHARDWLPIVRGFNPPTATLLHMRTLKISPTEAMDGIRERGVDAYFEGIAVLAAMASTADPWGV